MIFLYTLRNLMDSHRLLDKNNRNSNELLHALGGYEHFSSVILNTLYKDVNVNEENMLIQNIVQKRSNDNDKRNTSEVNSSLILSAKLARDPHETKLYRDSVLKSTKQSPHGHNFQKDNNRK